jgi:23S rRNA pseudouridine1911/1915/1917 synthase
MNHKAKQRQASSRFFDEAQEAIASPREHAAFAPKISDDTLAAGVIAGPHDFTVGEEHAGQRLDRFLAGAAEQAGALLSRTRLKTLIENGHVRIRDQLAADPGAKVHAGDQITLDVPPPLDPEPAGEEIDLAIVYEDSHLLILDKPAGLVVHPAAGHQSGTLVNALIAHCGKSLSGIGGIKRPGIVHRLDKDTSGLLVVAKTDMAHQGLGALFADHGRTLSLTRAYKAFVWGAPQFSSGIIEAPLGRHGTHREKIAVVGPPRGKEAITHWQVEERFGADRQGSVASLIACELETGRTHQIRVHMAHIGHPVLGDPLYATGFQTKSARLSPHAQKTLANLHRQALHAAVLGFTHPVTGEELFFESDLPADLQALYEALAGDVRNGT